MISNVRDFTPGLRPGFVDGFPGASNDAQIVAKPRCAAELEAKLRRQQQRSCVPLNCVVKLPVCDLSRDPVSTVGRGDAEGRLRAGSRSEEHSACGAERKVTSRTV